jgi:hypothetical protein
VQALNAPQFALDQRVAVAAWVNPTQTDNNRPVVLKRRENQTAFSLRIQNGQAQFSVTLDDNRTVTARAPISANVWSHVAGLFDGRFVFLFLNGQQVGQVSAAGSIADVDAPIRVGSTTQTQHFLGRIDEVWFSTNRVTPADIAALACVRQSSTFQVSPTTSGPVQPGTTFTYAVQAINRDTSSCAPRSYTLDAFPPSGLGAFSEPRTVNTEPGQTANFALRVTSAPDLEPGVTSIGFSVTDFSFFEQFFSQVDYEVAEPTGCHVSTARELLIRKLEVVEDPIRTVANPASTDPRSGAWTFGRLLQNAAPSPEQATEFVERVFQSWQTDQTVNSFTIPARPTISSVLSGWPRRGDGRIDIHRAPVRLLAIANRFDLRDLDRGHAGEGRFVFGVLGEFGQPLEFTIILEYQLPASTEAQALEWAQAWHALSTHSLPSEQYNTALQALTERFTARNAAPSRPNGSALLRLRSNEIALSFVWELREFTLGADGFLQPATVKLTPDGRFNFSDELAQFINANEATILAERHDVPESFNGAPFLGGAIFNNIDFWSASNITNPEARHKFSLNTCNGCHGFETGTGFLHVGPRGPGQESFLSGFMTGVDVFDPVNGTQRRLADLARRNADLKAIVCATSPAARTTTSGARVSLRKGIGRVH